MQPKPSQSNYKNGINQKKNIHVKFSMPNLFIFHILHMCKCIKGALQSKSNKCTKVLAFYN